MNQPAESDEAGVTERLEFLLATRIRYELHQRTPGTPAHRASEPDPELERTDPEQELRAADFLLATRALREANERTVRPGDSRPPGAASPR